MGTIKTREWLSVVLVVSATIGCSHRVAQPPPPVVLGRIEQVVRETKPASAARRFRVVAKILEVTATSGGTQLELCHPENEDDRLLVVFGTTADAQYAASFEGRTARIEFVARELATLPDGRQVLHIVLSSLKVDDGR
jgi:hypothetical protein